MYLSDEHIEAHVLRQGDIIQNVHVLGALNYKGITYNYDNTGAPTGWEIKRPPELGHSLVLSHSCEIEESNGVKLTSIILAPIRDIHTATKAEKIEDLIASNLITDETTVSYLKYFYLESNPKLPFDNGSIADFSKLFSVRKQCYDFLLANKILQLQEDRAKQMALKLALYFSRG